MLVLQSEKKTARFSKKKFNISSLVGKPYGSFFELGAGNSLVPCSQPLLQELLQNQIESDGQIQRDNRNLVDDNSAQKLGHDEILQLKGSESATGLVKKIAESSATFQDKTSFSQEKYLKKKINKHGFQVQVLKPTAQLLCETYFQKNPPKSCYLRSDSLSQLLTFGNVVSGQSVLLVDESPIGLPLAAILERLSGVGRVINLYCSAYPSTKASNCLNLKPEDFSILSHFPLSQLPSLFNSNPQLPSQSQTQLPSQSQSDSVSEQTIEKEKETDSTPKVDQDLKDQEMKVDQDLKVEPDNSQQQNGAEGSSGKGGSGGSGGGGGGEGGDSVQRPARRERVDPDQEKKKVSDYLRNNSVQSLVMVTRSSLNEVFPRVFNLLSLSGAFVVFSPYIEVLNELYAQLNDLKVAVCLQVNEIWTREYQVLPDRTHPFMSMHGASGYLLSGIKVQGREVDNDPYPPQKKQRTLSQDSSNTTK